MILQPEEVVEVSDPKSDEDFDKLKDAADVEKGTPKKVKREVKSTPKVSRPFFLFPV